MVEFVLGGRMTAKFEGRISLYLSVMRPVTSHWFVK